MHPHHFKQAATGLMNAAGSRSFASPQDYSRMKDYAFEMAGGSIKFQGPLLGADGNSFEY